jgi:hypothetical protein
VRIGGNRSGNGWCHCGRARIVAVFVIVAWLVQSLGLAPLRVMAQEDSDPTAVASEETVPPGPAAEPEPAVVVEPTIAPEPPPTVAPTDPPLPALEPTAPVVIPTVPVESPTPTEELPSPTAEINDTTTATATSTATVEVEPTVTPVPEPDMLTCAPRDTAAAQPGQLVEFGCVPASAATQRLRPGHTQSRRAASFRLRARSTPCYPHL